MSVFFLLFGEGWGSMDRMQFVIAIKRDGASSNVLGASSNEIENNLSDETGRCVLFILPQIARIVRIFVE